MRTRNIFGLALALGLMICTALMTALTVDAQTLSSGSYRVEVRNSGSFHPSVWRLRVSGNQIIGTTEWDCCPGPRVDPVRGYIEGNRVVIQRDCNGQGINGECLQVYYGTIGNGIIQGNFTGRGAAPGNVWTLFLGAAQPSTPTNAGGSTRTPGKVIDGSASAYRENVRDKTGQRFTFTCSPNIVKGAVWGTDIYTDDSSICTAAAHSGLITLAAGGTVTIEIRPTPQSYRGSIRYGITTYDYSATPASYVFVR